MLLSSAENWPKKDFCRLYTTQNLWNWVNCIQLMCYSSRSSKVWIRRVESAAFIPCNLWKWKGAFLKCCSFFVEVRWNERGEKHRWSTTMLGEIEGQAALTLMVRHMHPSFFFRPVQDQLLKPEAESFGWVVMEKQMGNLEVPVQLICMLLDWAYKHTGRNSKQEV